MCITACSDFKPINSSYLLLVKNNRKGEFFMFKLNQLDYQIDEFMTFCLAKNLSKKTMMSYEQELRHKVSCDNIGASGVQLE